MKTEKPNRKLAGLFGQIAIIFYKNLLLHKRNKLGILFELIFILFSLILLLLSYYSNEVESNKQIFYTEKIASSLPVYIDNGTPKIFYYPNNEFIKQIVRRAFDDVMVEIFGVNQSSPDFFNNTSKRNIVSFISFPDSYRSYKDLDAKITYTIFTPE